jgi:hypothetical protein
MNHLPGGRRFCGDLFHFVCLRLRSASFSLGKSLYESLYAVKWKIELFAGCALESMQMLGIKCISAA